MAFAPPPINVSDFDFHVGSATGQTLRLRKRAFKALIPLDDFRFNNAEGLSLSIWVVSIKRNALSTIAHFGQSAHECVLMTI